MKRKRDDNADEKDNVSSDLEKHFSTAPGAHAGSNHKSSTWDPIDTSYTTGHRIETASVVPKRASLLGLPAEVRICIYEYILLDADVDKLLTIDESNHLEPGLLQTSRHIRDEALELYYWNNTFDLYTTAARSAPHPGHWVYQACQYRGHDSPWIQIEGSKQSWPNFVDWLRLYHSGTTQAKQGDMSYIEDLPIYELLESMFSMVDTMEDCPWAQVSCAIEAWRPVFEREMSYSCYTQ